MKRCFSAVAMLAAALWVTGCGGGGGGSSPPPGPTVTRVVVNVNWPNRSRNIEAPSSALSMVVTIKGAGEGGTDYSWTIDRDVATTATTKRYLSPGTIKPGAYDVTIKLYAQAGGTGAVVGTAGAHVTIAADGTGLDALAVTGVVNTVEVPAGQSVPTGVKTDLMFTAKDSTGAIVAVTPGSATWTITSGGDKLHFVNGQAEATGNGTATVTATVDGKTSAPATVTVGATTGTLVVNAKVAGGSLVQNSTIGIYQGATKLDEKVSASGSQAFTGVPAGQIDIKISAAGYVDGQDTATVTVGTTTTKDVTLTPNSGTLIVNAKDVAGALIKNATIGIYQGTTKLDEKTTTTGSQTFTKVPTGDLIIKASAAGYQPGEGTATMTAGGTVTANVALIKSGTVAVSVKDPTGTLIAGPLIQLYQGGVKVAEATSLTGAQTFTNLAPGATEVRASAGAFKNNLATTTVVAGQTVNVTVTLIPRGKPQASTSPTVQTQLTGTTLTFQMDVSVRDEDGNPITGLSATAFKVDPTVVGTTTYSFALQSSVPTHIDNPGGYSAFLALDASDSVGTSDKNGSRIQAVKTFFSKLGSADNAAFGYFPASAGSPNLTYYPTIGFVGITGAPQYYQKIDDLNKKTFAGTPLYTATNQAVNYTYATAANGNKAVVVFTDGKATQAVSERTILINNAKAKGIKVYMVGLGSSPDPNLRPDIDELSLIAQSTGGSVMYATDAAQLVSFYGNLGQLLAGSGDFYRQTWTMTNATIGASVPAILKITLADGTVLQAPFYVVVH